LSRAGEPTPFLGGDGIAHDPMCISTAGDNSPGIYATVPIVDAASLPAAAAKIREFKASFGSTSDYGPYTIVAYDTTAVLYAALDRAIHATGGRLPARASVSSELARTAGLPGLTGSPGLDAQGDQTNRFVSIFEPSRAQPQGPCGVVAPSSARRRTRESHMGGAGGPRVRTTSTRVAFACGGTTGAGGASKGTIKIGSDLPVCTTGGQSTATGVKFAVDQKNAAGGV